MGKHICEHCGLSKDTTTEEMEVVRAKVPELLAELKLCLEWFDKRGIAWEPARRLIAEIEKD